MEDLMEYLENLSMEFDRYIPDRNLESQLRVRNPFLATVEHLSEDVPELQEELIDLHHDEFHRQLLSTASLGEFWASVKKEKRIIGNDAMTFLLPFATTYLREQEFSALLVIKTKVCNRLGLGDDIRIALSSQYNRSVY